MQKASTSYRALRRRLLIVGTFALVAVLIAIALLIAAAPAANKIFSDTVNVTCIYTINVRAFEDTAGRGEPHSTDKGVAGVQVSVEHSHPAATFTTFTPEQGSTDATGSVSFSKNTYCLADDTFTVRVTAPQGYTATTPLVFGPYPVPNYTTDGMTRAAAHSVPSEFKVGLRPMAH